MVSLTFSWKTAYRSTCCSLVSFVMGAQDSFMWFAVVFPCRALLDFGVLPVLPLASALHELAHVRCKWCTIAGYVRVWFLRCDEDFDRRIGLHMCGRSLGSNLSSFFVVLAISKLTEQLPEVLLENRGGGDLS